MKLLYCIDECGLKRGAHVATELLIAALREKGALGEDNSKTEFIQNYSACYKLIMSQSWGRPRHNTVPAASSLRGAGKRDGCYRATQRDAAGTVFADIVHLLVPNFGTLSIVCMISLFGLGVSKKGYDSK